MTDHQVGLFFYRVFNLRERLGADAVGLHTILHLRVQYFPSPDSSNTPISDRVGWGCTTCALVSDGNSGSFTGGGYDFRSGYFHYFVSGLEASMRTLNAALFSHGIFSQIFSKAIITLPNVVENGIEPMSRAMGEISELNSVR